MRDFFSLERWLPGLAALLQYQRAWLMPDLRAGLSVAAVAFLPPTLIASIYGMNFDRMPELAQTWGYPAALVAMVVSSAGAFLYFRWKNWI